MARKRCLTDDEERYLLGLIRSRRGRLWPVPLREIARRLQVHHNTACELLELVQQRHGVQSPYQAGRAALDSTLRALVRQRRGQRWPVPIKRLARELRVPLRQAQLRARFWYHQQGGREWLRANRPS